MIRGNFGGAQPGLSALLERFDARRSIDSLLLDEFYAPIFCAALAGGVVGDGFGLGLWRLDGWRRYRWRLATQLRIGRVFRRGLV